MRDAVLITAVVAVLAACGTPVASPGAGERAPSSAPRTAEHWTAAPATACTPAPDGHHAPCHDTGLRPLAVLSRTDDLVRLPTTLQRADPAQASVLVRVEYPDGCQQLRGAALDETSDSVTVYAVGTAPTGDPCFLRLSHGVYRVALSAPLRARQVLTAER